MQKAVENKSRVKSILLTIVAFSFVIFILVPILLSLLDGAKLGNIALIPIEGVITSDGSSYLGQGTVSSQDIVNYIKEANKNKNVKVILLEINSPGGSAVASDEIASAIKRSKKPVISVIREIGASGGYWIASATSYIIANRMSITGSIGVISSYLEFNGLMEKYGVNYEQLVAGKYKDMGTPFKKLETDERDILQNKVDKIHDFFIQEIAENRKISKSEIEAMATGEFYLGVEALPLGLVDQLGDRDTAEQFIKSTYKLDKIEYVPYQKELGFFEMLTGIFSKFSFSLGQGIAALFVEKENSVMLI